MEKSGYTDLLRVTYDVIRDQKLYDQFMDIMRREKGCFDEVVFFIHETHDLRNLDYIQKAADSLVPVFLQLKQLGYRVGIVPQLDCIVNTVDRSLYDTLTVEVGCRA